MHTYNNEIDSLNNQSKSNIETDKTQTKDYNKCNSCGFVRQNDED